MEIPDDLIEIHDPEIDPDQIMAQIRERVRQRRNELGYSQQTFPPFGAAEYPGEPEGGDFDEELYYHLRKANELYYQLDVEPALSPSPTTQMPILGRLWRMIRQEAHNLVLFYVGKLARQILAVDRHTVSTLNRMAAQIQEQQRQLQALREQLDTLSGTIGNKQ
jgi:hypothetical protein